MRFNTFRYQLTAVFSITQRRSYYHASLLNKTKGVYSQPKYDKALAKLDLIASNRQVTSLFEKDAGSSIANRNADAIPSMIKSLRQAGYTPSDLNSIRHIHVAGTKGKGSVCAIATSLLVQQKLGRPVGTYTSPHLIEPRERIAIDGEPVHQDIFSEAVEEIWGRFTEIGKTEMDMTDEEAQGPSSKPFYFRFMTILAWHIFIKYGVKDVVMECGIGGEYDATNIIPPEAVSAAVITQLGIDHVAMLGDTVEKIAWHKAGILKKGVTGFTMLSEDLGDVTGTLIQRAEEKEAKLVLCPNVDIEQWGGVKGKLQGSYQKYNQALALLAVRQHLGRLDITSQVSGSTAAYSFCEPETFETLSDEEILGLQEAYIRGRGEIIDAAGTPFYLNGAHTKESLSTVAEWLKENMRPDENRVLIFNTTDREIWPLLRDFLSDIPPSLMFNHVILTTNDKSKPEIREDMFKRRESWKADSPSLSKPLILQEEARDALRKHVPGERIIQVRNNLRSSLSEALAGATRPDRGRGKVVVTGSLHLVGNVLQVMESDIWARLVPQVLGWSEKESR